MKYDLLYQNIIETLNRKICDTWPEQAFAAASWNDLALNIEKVYQKQETSAHRISQQICIGLTSETPDGVKLAKINNNQSVEIPYMFDWSSYRGLYVCTKENNCHAAASVANKIACSILLRIFLSADKDELLIKKVDPKGLGKDLGMLPAQTNAPIIVDNEGVNRLISSIRAQIANRPIDAHSWRCDANENAFASTPEPLQIVLIANWDDLYDIRMGKRELSDAQNQIIAMLSSDVPARNGFYFVICGTTDDALNCFTNTLPVLSIDAANTTEIPAQPSYMAQLYSNIPSDKNQNTSATFRKCTCKLILPDNEQLQTILKAQRNFQSGTLNDTEADGLWKGNSAKGLRAVMGITEQGENQFFELGIGQAYDAFHALVGGATGSGKSVLLSEIICSLAERYSPQELRMLLLDYKEGTEFAPFKNLPHVYALSMGANPEFGLEVLKEVQKEIIKRGALFKEVNAKNLDEYRRQTGSTMCRYVLVADEFQILLSDRKCGEEAKTVLNDLVRRGRSFGFHAILATQTLRDGALDGEAKNQLGCRIAMRMAESETDYFLQSGNTVPATFNRKGQALVNYALGRKENNIIFQSGNKNMPKKFRDTPHVLECVNTLRQKAIAEHRLPSDVYIYSSDGFAQMPTTGTDTSAGALIGLRNNMQSTPVYLSMRQLGAKVLVLGGTENKRNAVLKQLANQLTSLYNEPVAIQTPGDYLDYPTTGQVTILLVPEGDFDLEDAIADWKMAGEQASQNSMAPTGMAMPQMSAFSAPQGMEDEFAALMQSMQMNNNLLNATAQAATQRRGRNRDTRCLIMAIATQADIKLMEAAGLYTGNFRTIIYLDHVIYNQVSGEYENSALGEAAALLESPKGVVTKIRLIK